MTTDELKSLEGAKDQIRREQDELVGALEGCLRWALVTIAKGNPECDVLPKGFDRWQALVEKYR